MLDNTLSVVFSSYKEENKAEFIAEIIFSFLRKEISDQRESKRLEQKNKCCFLIKDHTENHDIKIEKIITYAKQHCENDNILKMPIKKYIYNVPFEQEEEKFTDALYDFVRKDFYYGMTIITTPESLFNLDLFVCEVIDDDYTLNNYLMELEDKELMNENIYKIIHINIHNCHSIMVAIGTHENIGNLIVCKGETNESYSDGIKKIAANNNKIKSLMVYSEEMIEDERKVKVWTNGHYFFDKNFYYIRPTKKKINSIYKWVLTYFYPPSFYFSYSQDDNQHEQMKKIEKYITRYFNFISFVRKDKKPENSFMNLKCYHDQLISGDIIFIIIGEGFLTSFYPMKELFDGLCIKNALSHNEVSKPVINTNKISNTGIIPIITNKVDVLDYLYADSSKLAIAWENIVKSDDKKINPDKEKAQEILSNIHKIHEILKNTYNDTDINQHVKEGCRRLGWSVRNALKLSKKGYLDLYKSYNNFNEFPSIIEAIE